MMINNNVSNIKNLPQIASLYPDKIAGLSFIKEYYQNKLILDEFLRDYKIYINQQYEKLEIMPYDKLCQNFPFLGYLTQFHSFRTKPLYRHLNPTEPQLTKALSKFLLENQQSCQAFLQAVFTLLGKNITLPSKGYQCLCEVITCDVFSQNKRFKRIDNVILWEKEALCLEIKFEAVIDNNDLKVYEQQINKMAKGKNKNYVVISIDDIRDTIRQKKCDNWQNLRWCDVMCLWEQNIYKNNIEESNDLKRYRSSLWNKILYWEN